MQLMLKMPSAQGVLTQEPLIETDTVQFYERLARDPGRLNSPLLATLFRVLSRLEQKQRDREAFAARFGRPATFENRGVGVSL
jgi:hypothetical protein